MKAKKLMIAFKKKERKQAKKLRKKGAIIRKIRVVEEKIVKTATVAERKRRREVKKEKRKVESSQRRRRRGRVADSMIENLVEDSRNEVAEISDFSFADYPDPKLISTQSASGPYFINGSFEKNDVRGED